MENQNPVDVKDGGYKSRKMIMVYIAMFLILIAYGLTGKYPSLQSCFSQFCTSILTGVTIYSGSNTLVKWLAGKK